MSNYILNQIKYVEDNHNFKYNISIKFVGTGGNSHFLDITKEQLNKIKEIFENENTQ